MEKTNFAGYEIRATIDKNAFTPEYSRYDYYATLRDGGVPPELASSIVGVDEKTSEERYAIER